MSLSPGALGRPVVIEAALAGALALLPLPTGAEPAAAYLALARLYARGERAAAVAQLSEWTPKQLDRELEQLRAGVLGPSRGRPAGSPPEEPLLRAVIMLHTDRDALERGISARSAGPPRCGTRTHLDLALRAATLLVGDPAGREFSRRWTVAMALRALSEYCFDDSRFFVQDGLKRFPHDPDLLLVGGIVEEAVASLVKGAVPTGVVSLTLRQHEEARVFEERRVLLGKARRAFEQALAADGRLLQARLHLARVRVRLLRSAAPGRVRGRAGGAGGGPGPGGTARRRRFVGLPLLSDGAGRADPRRPAGPGGALMPGAMIWVAAALAALEVTVAGSPSAHHPGPMQETPTFAAGVDFVYVDAFVTREGRALAGLSAATFELEDNGERQRVELIAIESLPVTTLLVFDTSGSVEGGKLDALRSASEAFQDGLRSEDEIGLIGFSHEVRWLARPSPDRESLRRGLEEMVASGGTAVWDALYTALAVLETRSRTVVILFTDGDDNMSVLDAARVKAVAERSNTLVHVVGFRPPMLLGRGGQVIDPPEADHLRALRLVAEATGGRFWDAGSPERLGSAFAAIVAAMNTRYILRYEPSGTPRPGFHRIELRLRGEKGEVHARRGYWRAAPPP